MSHKEIILLEFKAHIRLIDFALLHNLIVLTKKLKQINHFKGNTLKGLTYTYTNVRKYIRSEMSIFVLKVVQFN